MSAMMNNRAGESKGKATQNRVGHLHRVIGIVKSHMEQIWVAMQMVSLQL